MTLITEHDVIVVGAGLSGLNAALAASKAGLDVVVLEKSDQVGGATGWSYGATWIACSAQAMAAGIADDPADAAAYLDFLGSGESDPARTRAVVYESARILAENEAVGVAFDLMSGVNDILYGKAPGAVNEGRTLEPRPIAGAALGAWRAKLRTAPDDDWWRLSRSVVMLLPDPAAIDQAVAQAVAADQIAQGPAIIAGLLLALLDRKVPILLETGVDRLIVEDDRVVGVRTAQGERRARDGVFLGTGSYKANRHLVAAIDKLPDYRPYFPPTAQGDGLVMASKVGAAIRQTRNNVVVMLGFDNPADPQGLQAGAPSTRELPRAHTMVVNAAGLRFGNEANFQELSRDIRALDWTTRTPKNLPCWMIVDHHYVAKWGIGGSAPGTVPDFVVVADSIAALARAAGIDAEGLVLTAERMNRFAASGVDKDFGRKPGWVMVPGGGTGKNPSLGSIHQAPFYAVRLFPTLGVGGGGVKADAAGRALDWQEQAIPGLYCAGDLTLHDEFGAGYQAGVTYASAMTFAWLAIEDMVAKRTKP